MKLGFPNHPRRNLLAEIDWIGAHGFEFVDVCLEPDQAGLESIDPDAVRARLDKWKLGRVGHTAYYLPIGSPMPELRAAAVEIAGRYLAAFAVIGAPVVTIHTHWPPGFFDADSGVRSQIDSLQRIVAAGRACGVDIMLEPLGTDRDTPERTQAVLDAVPGLFCHLDLGHCNLCGRTPSAMVKALAARLRHVHLNDNNGSLDLHLPPGAGNIDWEDALRALKATGYDGTITMEIFSADRDYALLARDKIRALWDRL